MKTALHLKVDKQVKVKAMTLAEKMGIPLSTLMNSLLNQFVRTETAVLSTARRMTPELEAFLDDIWKDIEGKRNFSKPIRSAQELREYFGRL